MGLSNAICMKRMLKVNTSKSKILVVEKVKLSQCNIYLNGAELKPLHDLGI